MRLLFAGTPTAAVPSLDALLASRHEVVAVLTRPAAAAGRGRRLVHSPVARWAAEAGVEVLEPQRPSDPDFLHRLTVLAPECCPVVGYGALLPAAALGVPGHGWINLHFSLLPAWRGAAPVQHALLSGDDVTGATTFRLVPELDAGPVLGTLTEAVRPRDTAGELQSRLATAGARLLVETLDHLADGSVAAVPQPDQMVSYAPKLGAADARVRWTDPATAVDRRIRACTPAPGAWTTWADHRLKLGPVRPVAAVTGLAPGELRPAGEQVYAGTGTHGVALGEVRPQGRRSMSAAAWARGARLSERALLGDGHG